MLALMLFGEGCKSIRPGHDPVVVNAERSVAIALDTFDLFLKLEFDNRERLKQISPDIFTVAEKFRREAPQWIASANNTIRAYKKNRTPEGKVSLMTAVAVLESALRESQNYIRKIQTP